ncbi:MAG TPA: Gfo/Idh/MocA family oxidoreductase [Vicinamibacterales bacterium]|nr:Gfo/Idh/MocA family oxidoreductase [Vicinamibacterales bacterium]
MIERRDVLKGAVAAFTTALFTGRVRGANDRIAIAHIGVGAMGSSNLGYALKLTDDLEPVAVCDVYQPALEKAVAAAAKAGKTVKAVKDFREILADKSVDAVCISTPDHWHAYMSVEACKAGKDVYVEKPASVYVEEGLKMVQAARKYNRVVQAGTMQRSGGYFKKAAEVVQSGAIGPVTFCHTWQTGAVAKARYGKPADGPVPDGLDWDMWLGPAPKVSFNLNRWGVGVARFPTFRYFWDYAGGAMTDWGVHLIDPVHQCFGEPMPTSISAMGDKLYVDDNTETPDTMMATFRYPQFLLTYESRTANPLPLFTQGGGAATSIHGTEGTLIVRRGGVYVVPNEKSEVTPLTLEKYADMNQMNLPHWQNFVECIRTRAKPTSDIETCVRSSTACILANLSMRHRTWLDWDEAKWTVKQDEIRPFLKARYRAPWKLEV